MNIIYLKDIPPFKKVLGFVLSLFGLYAFIFLNIIFGAIFIVLGVNLLSTEGSEINLENKTFRNIKSFMGTHFGKWKACPEFEYISVFKTKESQTIRVVTAEATIKSDIILLNLFHSRNKHITFYKTQDKADAFKVAERFKDIFGIDILDATTSEKKWL